MDTQSTPHVCLYQSELASLKKDAERNSDQHREFYLKFNELNTKQAIADERYNNILAVTNETKSILTELKEKPAKKWDNLSWLVVSSIVSLVIGGIVGSLL